MIKNERQKQILEILRQESFVNVTELSRRLFASCPTIRRDLSYLEDRGYVRRNHGGAMIDEDKLHHNPVNFRRGTKTHEKMNICRLAATLVPTDSLIFIDDSTTAYHLADFLGGIENVTVVTNGLSICQRLSINNIKTISTGGRLIKKTEAFVGHFAEQTVLAFNADVMFFSAAALGHDGSISDYSEEEMSLRIAMKARSKKTVFLCDSDKIGMVSEFRCFSLLEIDYMVTDRPLSEELMAVCRLCRLAAAEGAVLYGHVPASEAGA